jgi:uncharacterized membrane protein
MFKLRTHFLAGLLVLTPFVVIGWIVVAALQALWGIPELLPAEWQPEAPMLRAVFMLGAITVLGLAISLFGWISTQYLGQKLLELLGEIIQRIPVVRSIYSALDQLLRTMGASGAQQFSRVVYVEYPRKGVWTLAFVTGAARGRGVPAGHLNIYVPTTPNPTSGFHLIVPESDVKESHLSVEDAFKTILSLGIAQPTARGEING